MFGIEQVNPDEKAAKKRAEQAKQEILRCAPVFARLVNSEGKAVSEAFGLYVDKLQKYKESIAHLIAIKKIKKGEEYKIADLQGAYEALDWVIKLPQGYVEQMEKK